MASIKLDLSHDARDGVNTVDGTMSQLLGTSDEAIGSPTALPSTANHSRTRSGGKLVLIHTILEIGNNFLLRFKRFSALAGMMTGVRIENVVEPMTDN